jgi:hypothetical protein
MIRQHKAYLRGYGDNDFEYWMDDDCIAWHICACADDICMGGVWQIGLP